MDNYLRNLRAIRRRIEANISNIEKYQNNMTVLIEIKALLEEELTNFTVTWEEFQSYLSSVESDIPEARAEKSAQVVLKRALDEKVELSVSVIEQFISKIDSDRQENESVRSRSRSKVSSRASSSKSKHMTDMLIERKVKLETAKARLLFVQEEEKLRRKQYELELQVKKSQSEMESNLNILKCKQEIVESEAELKAVEEIAEEGTISSRSSTGEYQLPSETSKKSDIVKDFINKIPDTQEVQTEPVVQLLDKRLSANTPEFVPEVPVPDHGISVLTKYIMKKDLLLSRLSNFDDKAERYISWKNSFHNITREIDVTPTEEIDLLLRYLGPDSKRQAVSIRVANSQDDSGALEKIWTRLDQRFGAPEHVAESLRIRVDSFPKITADKSKFFLLYDLSDLLEEIECVKNNNKYHMSMSYFDSSLGVNSVLCKLPTFIQNKWVDHCTAYKTKNNVMYPPFLVFVDYVKNFAIKLNDPSFNFDRSTNQKSANRDRQQQSSTVHSRLTHTNSEHDKSISGKVSACVLHGENSKHTLQDCMTFLQKSIPEKREIVKQHGLCFKCMTYKHLAKDCKISVKCEKCSKASHCTAFHIDPESSKNHGGEPLKQATSICTEICGNSVSGKSCAKTLLVNVYPEGERHKAIQCYAIIDDQSNRTLGKTELFERFSNSSVQEETYMLSTCAGSFATVGKRISGLVLESHDATCALKCPPILECNDIPDNKNEIPTPNIARLYPHLNDIAHLIPELCPQANILVLIGRDMLEAHHVLDQRLGLNSEPYGQQLRLGWTIIGETCLGKVHQSSVISVNKISVLYDGRNTILQPCESVIHVKENDVFERTRDDDTVGMSQDDKQFIKIMDTNMKKMSNGHLSAPLPFIEQKPRLPSNYEQAKHRAESLVKQLRNNPLKCKQFVEFMGKIFDNNQAEVAPPVEPSQEVWYLPIFGVFHPKKPDKIRVVFDSAAKYRGLSLNDVLLTGPDLTNNLAAVLINFRRERYAAMADVEQMFFNFEVHEEHRNFLRFIWFQDNDIAKSLIDYRMRVHVFGNSPSPAVATYGMRNAVCDHDIDSGECDSVCDYVKNNFYVDDGLVSNADEDELVELIKQTQERLLEGGSIRLHKIVSNSPKVLKSFPAADLAKDITEIDFSAETPFFQRSLGISWDVVNDIFTYKVPLERKPYTKRGVLSTINGLFDPLGFVAPVVLGGRLIMKQAVQDQNLDWDDQLSESLKKDWISWQDSLTLLEKLEIPRTFTELSFDKSSRRELHIFSDASKEAISAVAYLRTVDSNGSSQIGFVQGKSKLAPSHGHTIPRLELCAAVVATELAAFIQKHLNIKTEHTYYYTDSQVVLGYINNTSRRFYIYVGNRVDKILKHSSRAQWNFVPTEKNPADYGTRPVKSENMKACKWLQGPEISDLSVSDDKCNDFELIYPEQDSEVRPVIEVKKVEVESSNLGCHRFERFSSWRRLVSAISFLKQKAATSYKDCQHARNNIEFQVDAEETILKEVQKVYISEIECLQKGKSISRNSSLLKLFPVLDSKGLLRVGGRLKNASLDTGEKTPVIIPGKSHIAMLLVRYHHEKVAHQGRHLTEGAVRSAGFWITGGRRLISSVIHHCVRCRRLRRPVETQKMSDLPPCRVTASAPFTYVGVDTFGPWSILTGKTRGGASNSKRWAILFSCLYTRAVHIEVVEDMSASCFINALRRFIAIRGPVKEFYSDRGTNFVGAVSELGIEKVCVEDLRNFLTKHGTLWYFNTPHSSHMNGAWERMIGLARRILESLLCDSKHLTHEVLCTLMAEVVCIINSRPITTISNDPTLPTILSPNMLLTHKQNSDIEPRKDLGVKDMYRSQWRQVQVLADQFWKRWKSQYLQNLQTRQKWQTECANVKTGDVVLLVEDNVPRIQWQVGVVDNVFSKCR